MRRIQTLAIALFISSCSDGGLPGNPVFLSYEAAGTGDSLTLYWAPLEGVDYYSVYLDGNPYWEGTDTFLTVPYFETITLKARGLGDETETSKSSTDFLYTDTLLVKPQVEGFTMTAGIPAIKGLTDTASYQYFFVFLAKNTDSLGYAISEGDLDSLWLYSASRYFDQVSGHKVDSLTHLPVVNLPSLDSVKFWMDSTYVLWYSPDTLGWGREDYFLLFRADSVEVDSLGDLRLRIIYTVNKVSGLRWF